MKKFALIPLTALLLAALHANTASAIGRLANIEIQDRNEQRSLPIYWHQGRAYIVGRPGNEYQVLLRNQADADVLAVVSVDGINVISGETAATQQSGYVINYGQRMEIAGWRKSMDRTAAFYFTSLGDSYAARTGRPDNVGVIGVALYRRKAGAISVTPYAPPYSLPQREGRNDYESKDYRGAEPGAPAMPAAEGYLNQDRAESAARLAPAPKAKAETPLGTGHGRSESSSARYVSFERRTQSPEEQFVIYYDSYANLVARGIIAAPRPREPQAFPGTFVPDPWR